MQVYIGAVEGYAKFNPFSNFYVIPAFSVKGDGKLEMLESFTAKAYLKKFIEISHSWLGMDFIVMNNAKIPFIEEYKLCNPKTTILPFDWKGMAGDEFRYHIQGELVEE